MAPNQEYTHVFVSYDAGWKPTACPKCGDTAVSHGYLYIERDQEGHIKAFEEVWGHQGKPDCQRHDRLKGDPLTA